MHAITPTRPAVGRYLPDGLKIGEPDLAGTLAVFPLFGVRPRLDYLAFAQAAGRGAEVRELSGGALVNDLVVDNASDTAVLLYEGEEVLGAQQNRTFDVTVLVPARMQVQVPVSCVEAGRWDGARQAEPFRPAPQAAYPELRRIKNRRVSQSLAAGAGARAEQGEVWREVCQKVERHRAVARTSAMGDVFEHQRADLRTVRRAIGLRPPQQGMLALIGRRFAVLDWVSRLEVFAALHAPLVECYALDALEARLGAVARPRRGGRGAHPHRAR
jgi:hypothetical protein